MHAKYSGSVTNGLIMFNTTWLHFVVEHSIQNYALETYN